MATRAPLLSFTYAWEGGYQNEPEDDGNWTGGRQGFGILVGTNRGIAAATLLARRRKLANDHDLMISAADMQSLSLDESDAIYGAEFLDALDIDNVPAGADLMLFDCSVMHWTSPTVELAQRLVGATADGEVGPHTIAAIQQYGVSGFITDMDAAFRAMLQQCRGWPTYQTGWTNRCDQRVRAAQQLAWGGS